MRTCVPPRLGRPPVGNLRGFSGEPASEGVKEVEDGVEASRDRPSSRSRWILANSPSGRGLQDGNQSILCQESDVHTDWPLARAAQAIFPSSSPGTRMGSSTYYVLYRGGASIAVISTGTDTSGGTVNVVVGDTLEPRANLGIYCDPSHWRRMAGTGVAT